MSDQQCCKTCAKRGQTFVDQFWFHPAVAAAGINICTVYPKNDSLIQVTPDDFICSFYQPAQKDESHD